MNNMTGSLCACPVKFIVSCFPGGTVVKNSSVNAGDAGDVDSVPGFGKTSPGVGNGNPLQYSCLEYSTDRGEWRATVHGIAESDSTERLCKYACSKMKLNVEAVYHTQVNIFLDNNLN